MAFSDFYSSMTSSWLSSRADEPEASTVEELREVLTLRRQELDATILFCHTMYEYMQRKGLLDEAEFAALYDELDLRDGRRDHRAGDQALPATEGRAGGEHK